MSDHDPQMEAAVEDMTHFIRREVAAGFTPYDRIVDDAVEVAGDGLPDPESLRSLARELTRDAVREHYHAQAQWPDRTDCDKLDEAFTELEGRGIVCRHNFSCCGTCGSSEIWEEMRQARNAGRPVVGYAFYHMQDTESATQGYGLYLNYGATEDGQQAALVVAREIVAVLNSHGLATDWNGDWRHSIAVSLDWKRRRPIEVNADSVPRLNADPIPGLFDHVE